MRSPLVAEEASCFGEGPCICGLLVGYDSRQQPILPAKLNQDRFHCKVPLPLRKTGQLRVIDLVPLAKEPQ